MVAPFALQSYGENHYKTYKYDHISSVHAEANAIKKLQSLPRQRRPKKIDLMVVRVSCSGKLGSSKPCLHCIVKMYRELPIKGYNLEDVYYTDSEGVICCKKFIELLDDDTPHVSKYYKERNMANKFTVCK